MADVLMLQCSEDGITWVDNGTCGDMQQLTRYVVQGTFNEKKFWRGVRGECHSQLAHELLHAAVGVQHKHKGLFIVGMKHLMLNLLEPLVVVEY